METGKKVLNGINKFCSIMTGIGLIVAAIWIIGAWNGVDMHDIVDEAIRPEVKYIESIKQSSLAKYSPVPLGEVLEFMYAEPKWTYIENNGKHFVEFSGLNHSDMGAYELKTKFQINDGGTFEVSYVALDGGLLNPIESSNFLAKMFEE